MLSPVPAHGPGTSVRAAVAVLVPVYNEAGQVGRTLDAIDEFARTHPGYRFTLVDDGSTDDTVAIVSRRLREPVSEGLRSLELLATGKNGGKCRAIRAGLNVVDAPLVCYIDGDLAYSLDHLEALVAALAEGDVAIGSRHLVGAAAGRPGLARRVLGESFNTLCRAMLWLPYRDTQAGLKGFRLEAARSIFARQRLRDFAFDAELLYIAKRDGLRIREVPAKVSRDHAAKKSTVNLLSDPARMLISLLRVRVAALRGLYG
jgi:dolichyl-phosphate beta-glucosyltransferase